MTITDPGTPKEALASGLLQFLPLLSTIVALVLAYSALRERDATFEQRLLIVEERQKVYASDHDILVDMRADVRAIKMQMDRLLPPGRMGSAPPVIPGALTTKAE